MLQVTGAVHEVGANQLSFSTTDVRGIIRYSNNVSIKFSRYWRDELSGTPHSIAHHPEMPGGTSKAMWDTFKAGSLFAAYVHNLAADGSEYNVFATVTLLPDGGYLSVHTQPVHFDPPDTACIIYRDARVTENQVIDDGASRWVAAEEGLDRIAEMPAGAGLSSYEKFRNTALPAEVARRKGPSDSIPVRPGAAGDLRIMLDSVARVAARLGSWMSGQQQLAGLSVSFKAAGKGLTRTLKDPRLSVEHTATLDRSDPRVKPLADLLDLWAQMRVLVSPPVARLVDTPAQSDINGARIRLRIAPARLHTTITSLFAIEFIDGIGDSQYSAQAIPDLIKSLHKGIAEVERQVQTHRVLTVQTVAYTNEASRMMTIPSQLLILRTGSATSSGLELPVIAAKLSSAASGVAESMGRRLAELDDLAVHCQTTHAADNFMELGEALDSFTTAAEAIAPS